jgi:hypothetical protein
MRGRMYDPTLRRFLTTDPVVAEPLFGQSYNPYSYVNNNPVNRIDPTGFTDSPATIVDVFSFESPKETSGTNWNLATRPELEGYVVNWSYSRADIIESNDPPYAASGVDSHPARGFHPASVNPLSGGNISPGWDETPLTFEGPSTEAGEDDLYALPSLPRDTSEYLACGPCIFVPPIIIWLSISGDTDVPGSGSPEMFAIGTALLGGGSIARLAAAREVSVAGRFPLSAINATGGTTNCVNCALALDATLGGSQASALGGPAVSLAQVPALFGATGFMRFSSATGIDLLLRGAGASARGIVVGVRGAGMPAHAFNAVNQGGVVSFLDAQVGGAASVQGYQFFLFIQTF